MKTVFGHAIIPEGSASAVYNCKFDLEDKFIITGADDGIIKVWSKDTLILQASLHGHMDVIIEIAISKCNRYMASGSKDGTLIIWDLQKCQIIKRITDDHSHQVNKVQFVMIQCTPKHAQKNMANLQMPGQSSKMHQSQIVAELRQFEPMATFPQNHSEQILQTQYDQFLMTCSDDGSINIYDVSSFSKQTQDEYYTRGVNNCDKIYTPHSKYLLNQKLQKQTETKNEITKEIMKGKDPEDKVSRRTRKRALVTNTNNTTAHSSSQSQCNTQEPEIFRVKLRPEDFRQGSRNKHIDSFSVNSRGFLAGGTNHGEVYLWKVNFANIRNRKVDSHYHWINSFKLHKKATHNLQFSPDGDMLLTGSADGTSVVWDTRFVAKNAVKPVNVEDVHEFQPVNLKDIELTEAQVIYRFQEKNISSNTECLIDAIEWSAKGRYAYCGISVKDIAQGNEQQKPAIVKIKVYDTYSGEVIESLDLACKLKKEFFNYSSVLKAHPFKEEVILSCFDGGSTVMYDVRRRKIVQQIEEYCIYSIEQFTMNNAIDVDFSSDGQYLALTSLYGTLTLYSTEAHREAQYHGTRVQQFFQFDNQMHDHNVYERHSQQPQLCGFELNPYEQQPVGPLIGPFQRTEDSFEDFERQQLFAREFAIEEEKFYQDQLKDGLRLGYFTGNASVPGADAQRFSNVNNNAQRLLPSNIAGVVVDAEMHEGSDEELIHGTRTRPVRAARRLVRTDELPEDIDLSNDIEADASDEDFQGENSGSEDNNEDDEEAEEDGFVSEYAGNKRISANRADVPYWDQSRENYHHFDIQNSDEEMKVEGRNGRAQRRNGRRNQSQSQESVRRGQQQARRRLRQVIHSGETSQFDEAADDQSNFGPQANRRNIVIQSESDDEDTPVKRRSSRNRGESNENRRNRRQPQQEARRQGLRNNATRRVRADSSVQIQESELEYSEAVSYKKNAQKDFDEQFEKQITAGPTQIDPNHSRDDNFSQRGSKNKKGAVIIKEGRMSAPKGDDEMYELGHDQTGIINAKCYFCKKSMDKHCLIGPFHKKQDEMDQQIMETELAQNLYFHQKCLEANNYVRYDKNKDKWVNIDTAIKNLVQNKTFTCYRCLHPGATVQCQRCDRTFHGHYCQNQYLLPTDETETVFVCLFCRNEENFCVFKQDIEKSFHKYRTQELDGIRKAINKEYLFETKPGEFYLPQLRDEVMYFFQGHEKFVQSNNCFFYSGVAKHFGSTDLPWMKQSSIRNIPKGSLHCLVVNITHKFAHGQSSRLIQQYGNCSSDIMQVEKIVTYVELQSMDPEVRCQNFIIQIFPSEATQYIIPIQLFSHKYELFQKHFCAGTLIGKRFKTHRANQLFSGHDVKVHEVKPLEPEFCSESHWESIVVSEVDNQAMMRNRRGADRELFDPATAEHINFWDLLYPEESETSIPSLIQEITPKAFDELENKRVLDGLELFIQKKSDTCFLFLERVSEQLAPDYKSFISAEMWLELILARLRSRYYRSQDQLWYDLDLIIHCSKTYNGNDDELTYTAEAMVEKIRKELRTFINTNLETKSKPPAKTFNFNKNKKAGPQLGFDEVTEATKNNTIQVQFEDDLPKRKTRQRFGQGPVLGAGGASVKDILNDTLHQETLQVQQDSKIVIDFAENLSSQNNKTSPGNLLSRRTQKANKIDHISVNGMFTVQYEDGVITIDRSFGNSGKRSTRQIGKKRKRMDDSDSEDYGGSNIENSMSHNLERRSKRQRV